MVELGSLDVLEAHADGDQLVPGGEGLRFEEVGSVVRCKGLVDLECCDFRGNWMVLAGAMKAGDVNAL